MNDLRNLALGALLLLVACGGGDNTSKIILPDVQNTTCDPLMQTGCAAGQKCTWIVDATNPPSPQYVGHIGCAPIPAAPAGDAQACMYGMPGETGYDNCDKGYVCSSYKPRSDGTWPAGFCKQICDHQGGMPMCDSEHVCVRYSLLFKSGSTAPTVAGVCDVKCDPFLDNDYDGAGTDQKSATTKCPGSDTATGLSTVGCYGFPSGGTAPKTGYSCTNDIHFNRLQPTGLRHRVQCVQNQWTNEAGQPDGCADTVATGGYTNSCNQGYIPLLYDSYAVQTAICTAMCKPLNCYKGNCGPTATSDINHFGAAGDSCTDIDRVAGPAGFTYDGSKNGDHCQYAWSFEIDRMTGTWLPSDYSDSVGYCVDHTKWVYDSDNDGAFTSADLLLPRCADLNVAGSHATADLTNPTTYWGAGDAAIGCVDHTTAGLMFQNKTLSAEQRKMLQRVQRPRALYDAEVAPP